MSITGSWEYNQLRKKWNSKHVSTLVMLGYPLQLWHVSQQNTKKNSYLPTFYKFSLHFTLRTLWFLFHFQESPRSHSRRRSFSHTNLTTFTRNNLEAQGNTVELLAPWSPSHLALTPNLSSLMRQSVPMYPSSFCLQSLKVGFKISYKGKINKGRF